MDWVVTNNEAQSRFELRESGKRIAIADYVDAGQERIFTHTFVDPPQRGRGVSVELIGKALENTKQAGLKAVPKCWAVARYVSAHPDSVLG